MTTDDLEKAVDSLGLCEVVALLSEVCGLKAEHVRSAWQDEAQAKVWDRARYKLEGLVAFARGHVVLSK
jgi:hypothetical protein